MNILFAGTPELAANHLRAILGSGHPVCGVITRPDKPGKRGTRAVAPAVKQLALSHGLPVIQPEKLEADQLTNFDADLMVVVAYGQLLSPAVLNTPPLGCINVHASLLPRWRGAAPIQHAIMAGDEVSGVSVMRMDEGLDTGPILATREVTLDADETAAGLTEKLSNIGPDALLEVLAGIQQKTITPRPQYGQDATYAPKLTKADARLDWNQPALALARSIRAFNPDPVAWTLLDDLRIKVWFARAVRGNHEAPGSILEASRAGVTVACGEDALLVTRLQLPVGKGSILDGTDIVNARRELLAPGKRFT